LLIPQPLQQPSNFVAEVLSIRQSGENRLHRVEHHAPGPNFRNALFYSDQQTFEREGARFDNLSLTEVYMRDLELLGFDQALQIETKRPKVLEDLGVIFLERKEQPRFVELSGAVNQELHGKDSLAATGAATNQRRAAGRKTSFGDLVQSGNACPHLIERAS